jgi:hypothetical protein
MCWFIHFRVVLQKDTPHSRSQIAELPKGCATCDGTFPEFTIPKGFCGCSFVCRDTAGRDGCGIIDEAAATLRHFIAQPPVKRIDVWWHWETNQAASRPAEEERIELGELLARNAALRLGPDVCYRVTDLSKF